jgi:hypothetical protein
MSACPPLSISSRTCPSTTPPFRGVDTDTGHEFASSPELATSSPAN